ASIPEHETCTSLAEPTRSSAHSGPVPDALYNLGRLYDDRERNGNAANAAEARCWYEKAAIAGHTAAMLKLGSIYEAGRGVEQNVAEAIKWYEKAAKNKDAEGMFNLAALSEAGRGIAPDRGRALIWYARAAGDDMKAEFDPYGVGSMAALHMACQLSSSGATPASQRGDERTAVPRSLTWGASGQGVRFIRA